MMTSGGEGRLADARGTSHLAEFIALHTFPTSSRALVTCILRVSCAAGSAKDDASAK